jgi:hypothetical protein
MNADDGRVGGTCTQQGQRKNRSNKSFHNRHLSKGRERRLLRRLRRGWRSLSWKARDQAFVPNRTNGHTFETEG